MIPLLVVLNLSAGAAEPETQPAPYSQPALYSQDAWKWGAAQGLMAGVVVMHGVQPLAVATGEAEWKDKYYVSLGGTALYGTTLAGMMARNRWSLYVAIIGPAVGLSSILTGWGLNQAGVIESDIRPDTFQIAGGVLQAGALVLSVDLLRRDRPHALAVGTLPGADPGLMLSTSW